MSRASLPATILVCVLATLAFARPVAAQSPGLELYGGYSYLHDPGNAVLAVTSSDNQFRVGWMAGASRPLWEWISGVAEVSGHYKRRTAFDDRVSISFHAVMGGPKASAKVGRLTEFAQALVGVTHGSASAFGITAAVTALSIQPGGGIDYPLTSRLAARLQLDYRWIRNSAEGRAHASQFRAAAALVYR